MKIKYRVNDLKDESKYIFIFFGIKIKLTHQI